MNGTASEGVLSTLRRQGRSPGRKKTSRVSKYRHNFRYVHTHQQIHTNLNTHSNIGPIESANGSAMVRIGETTMIAGINLEIVQPGQNTPKEGDYELNVHLWPICSSSIRPGAAPEEAFSLADFLNKTIFNKKNEVIDMSQLCVEEGRACWVMKVDVLCLEHDGNLEDAASLAVISALHDLRVPAHEYDEEKDMVHLIEGDAKALHIQHSVMTSTFGLFEKSCLICDQIGRAHV